MEFVFPHLKNFRDFEGYRCKDGSVLKGNVFARSDNPCSLQREEIRTLASRGFTSSIDLRRANERENRPDLLGKEEGFYYYPIIMNDAPYLESGDMTLPDRVAAAYFEKLTVSADRIAAIFRVMAEAENGVLFHCESGKDRTGTIAALLLLLCGVEDEQITEDYHLSYECMYVNGDPALLADPTLIPKREVMNFFLEKFHEEYPDPLSYFRKIGLKPEETDRILKKIKTTAVR